MCWCWLRDWLKSCWSAYDKREYTRVLQILELNKKRLKYDSHNLVLGWLYEDFLMNASEVHLVEEPRQYPRRQEHFPYEDCQQEQEQQYYQVNSEEEIRQGERRFKHGTAPLMRIHDGKWLIVRKAYCWEESPHWLLLQYHRGASFSMLDLDLHDSLVYDLGTPDGIQRARRDFDEVIDLVLDGLEKIGIPRSHVLVSNSPGDIYCGQRVSGRYIWIKHQFIPHKQGNAMWKAFQAEADLTFETNFDKPTRNIRLFGQPFMEMLVEDSSQPLGKRWRVAEPRFCSLCQQAYYRFGLWYALPETDLKKTLGRLAPSGKVIQLAEASDKSTKNHKANPTPQLQKASAEILATQLLEQFTQEEIKEYLKTADTFDVLKATAGRTYSPLTRLIESGQITQDQAIAVMCHVCQVIRPPGSHTRMNGEQLHRRWFEKFRREFDPSKVGGPPADDVARFEYMRVVTPDQIFRYIVEATVHRLRNKDVPRLRELLERLYEYGGRIDCHERYRIAAGKPVGSPKLANSYYWERFLKRLPEGLFILLDGYEIGKKCEQWAADPAIITAVKRGSQSESEAVSSQHVPQYRSLDTESQN